MPGNNPSQAFHKFISPLQRDISCISRDPLIVSAGGRYSEGGLHSLTLSNGPILLNDDGVQLDIGMQYAIVRTDVPGAGPFKVSTRAYNYALLDIDGEPIIAHHWHPYGLSSHQLPHFHIHTPMGAGITHKQHHPSGRVSLEQVIRFCIEELRAEPLRDDWDEVLAINEGRFKLHRSWSDVTPVDAED